MYRPWSSSVLSQSLSQHLNGEIPILDLELTRKCSHKTCVYCDSVVGDADKNELSIKDYNRLISDSKKLGVQWVHICGLGEPSDYANFIDFVGLLNNHDIKLSFFTNGLNLSKDVIDFLYQSNACLIVKMDSFDEKTFDKVLGQKQSARTIYKTIDYLVNSNYPRMDSYGNTNLAFSIVPTSLTLHEIPEIVKYCLKNNIFPSIGALEYAGKGKNVYDELMIPPDQLKTLKEKVSEILGYEYYRPVCPSIFTGVHIDNVGHCIVHKKTGLNCGWFLLSDPEYKTLGNIKEKNICELNSLVFEYRRNRMEITLELLAQQQKLVFGGCGGNASDILNNYVKTIQSPHLRQSN